MIINWIGLVLVTVTPVQARTFNNPILGDKDYYDPGAVKVNGTYYVVAQISGSSEQFPIHTSTDLISWVPAGYVFDDTNTPTWVGSYLYEPEIHKIGTNYVVYFRAMSSSSQLYAVGAAIASHPLGPYTALDRPIQPLLKEPQFYPTLIKDEASDKLYLMWRGLNFLMKARQLNSNGLSFFSDQTATLIRPSLDWEKGYINSPWYIQRGNYHYLLYTAGSGCNETGIGVARSSYALGPYEKLPNPILVPNSNYACSGYPSVVKDLDDKGHLIFFTAYLGDEPNIIRSVVLASVGWDADDWPFFEDLSRVY